MTSAEISQCSIVTGPLKSSCCFCKTKKSDELKLGPVYRSNDVLIHYYCLLTASSLPQNGEDHEGILGFYLSDIKKESKLSSTRVCSFCKLKGATVICSAKLCKKWFHLTCGLERHSLHQFFGKFKSFCGSHRPKQRYDKRLLQQAAGDEKQILCPICYEKLDVKKGFDCMWAPCCKKNAWFHRDCVQRLALSAGYFFKCPLCNNEEEFCEAMKRFGIYVPQRDALWEQEPHAFEELLHIYASCDAPKCACPQGRRHEGKTNTNWELIRCGTCGSQAIHTFCGRLKRHLLEWNCQLCATVLGSTETRVDRAILRSPPSIPSRKEVGLFEDDDEGTSDATSRASSPEIDVAGSPQSTHQLDCEDIFSSPRQTEESVPDPTEVQSQLVKRSRPSPKRHKKYIGTSRPCPKRHKKYYVDEEPLKSPEVERNITDETSSTTETNTAVIERRPSTTQERPTVIERRRSTIEERLTMTEGSPMTTGRSPITPWRSPIMHWRSSISLGRSPTSPVRSPISPVRSPTSPVRSPTSPVRSPISPGRSSITTERRRATTDDLDTSIEEINTMALEINTTKGGINFTTDELNHEDIGKTVPAVDYTGSRSENRKETLVTLTDSDSDADIEVLEVHRVLNQSSLTINDGTTLQVHPVSEKNDFVYELRAGELSSKNDHIEIVPSNRISSNSMVFTEAASTSDHSSSLRSVDPKLFYPPGKFAPTGVSTVTTFSGSAMESSGKTQTPLNQSSDFEEIYLSADEDTSTSYSSATDVPHQSLTSSERLTYSNPGIRSRISEQYRLPVSQTGSHSSVDLCVNKTSKRSYPSPSKGGAPSLNSKRPCAPNQLPTASKSTGWFNHSSQNQIQYEYQSQSVPSLPSGFLSTPSVQASHIATTNSRGFFPAGVEPTPVNLVVSSAQTSLVENPSYCSLPKTVWTKATPSTSDGIANMSDRLVDPASDSEIEEEVDTGLSIKITNVRHSNEFFHCPSNSTTTLRGGSLSRRRAATSKPRRWTDEQTYKLQVPPPRTALPDALLSPRENDLTCGSKATRTQSVPEMLPMVLDLTKTQPLDPDKILQAARTKQTYPRPNRQPEASSCSDLIVLD